MTPLPRAGGAQKLFGTVGTGDSEGVSERFIDAELLDGILAAVPAVMPGAVRIDIQGAKAAVDGGGLEGRLSPASASLMVS
jgi:hypothetical protein